MMIGYGASGTHDFYCYNAAGQVWNGAAFVTWADDDYASYRVTATEVGTSGRFTGTAPADTELYELRVRGASLALSYVVWTNTTLILTAGRLDKIDEIGTASFLPVTGTVQARVSASQITVYTAEVVTVTLGLEDTNGTAVDTTGMTLELVLESGTTDVTISDASITKATNGISFAITSALNSSERDWNYALRKSDETVLQTGVLSIQYAPNN